MNPISSISAVRPVSKWDNIAAVRVAPGLGAGQSGHSKEQTNQAGPKKTIHDGTAQISGRMVHNAKSAACTYAAHLLAEAGVAGKDPYGAQRMKAAYHHLYNGPVFCDFSA